MGGREEVILRVSMKPRQQTAGSRLYHRTGRLHRKDSILEMIRGRGEMAIPAVRQVGGWTRPSDIL